MKDFPALLERLCRDEQISQKDLAERSRLTSGYISLLIRGERTAPSKKAVKALANALNLDGEKRALFFKAAGHSEDADPPISDDVESSSYQLNSGKSKEGTIREDWGQAPNIQGFYGRQDALGKLEQWIVKEKCQMIVVLGIGGVGKTTLASKLAEQIKGEFDYIFWRSLQHAPTMKNILSECIHFLSNEKKIDLPEDVEGQVTQLIGFLREYRCLVVLDNFEAVLQKGQAAGQYMKNYEDYGQLLQRIGGGKHQSCLLLTSREKPKEVVPLPVRSFQLLGVTTSEGQKILEDRDLLGSKDSWNDLVQFYSGNPLALKLVSETIREVFGGDIAGFLKKGERVFGEISDFLNQQFHGLSELEQEIMCWLAIEREALSLEDLQADLVHPVSQRELLVAIGSLHRRSMIENSEKTAQYTLQSVIMEYVTDHLIKEILNELKTETIRTFANYALIKAQAKDYVRNIQILLILRPIANELLSTVGKAEAEMKLKRILSALPKKGVQKSDYAAGNILNLLLELGCDLGGYDFSHLVVWQAYLKGVTLPDVNFAHADLGKSVFTDTFGSILSVALSPNGQILMAGTADGEIWLWDAANGVPLRTCLGHTDWIRSVVFSPDGQMLASGSADQTVRLWDVNTGKCLKTLQGHDDKIWSVAFNPDGQMLASGSADQTVRLWDVNTGKCLKTLQGHTRPVYSVAFSPDGKILASGSADQTVRLWDVNTGKCLKTLQGHEHWVRAVVFSPDGRSLASGCEDQTVRLWDVNTGQCLKMLQGHTDWVRAVAFSPDGKMLASGSADQTVRLWDVGTGQCFNILQGHTHWVRAVAFNPDGKTLASGGEDQTVRLWDVKTGQCLKTLQGYIQWVRAVAFSPDGKMLASGSADQTVRLWDVKTGQCLKMLQGHTDWVRAVAFSPDGKMLASGSEDRTVRLWDVNTSRDIEPLQGHTHWVYSVTFSPDGKTLASSSEDQTVRLWNVDTGQCSNTLQEGHIHWVYSVAFSPDGRILASGSQDKTVHLWDMNTGQLKTLQGHTHWVRAVAFSPDGKMLASGSADQQVYLWDMNTGQCLKALQGHADGVRAVAFSPDGKVLASGSEDKTVRLWDVSTGQCLKTLQGHIRSVYSVAFSPDGKILATGSNDGTIKFWNMRTGESQTLKADRPYERMNITGVKGLELAQKTMLKALGAIEDEKVK